MQDRISAAEYQRMTVKPSKMRNVKTVVDGRMFDSKKEADYYYLLKAQKQQGEIIDFFCQVPFLVHDGYYKDGRWIKPIYYYADFLVIKPGDFWLEEYIAEIHETKGRWTRLALDKRKMFEKRYPEYKFIVI
jgi:hypothetical protein